MDEQKENIEHFGRDDFLQAFEQQMPSSQQQKARELAALVRRISDKSIRITAQEAQLDQWLSQLSEVAEAMELCEQRDAKTVNKRLFKAEASKQDVYDVFDYDPATGHANPDAPLIEFTAYGERVKARVFCQRQKQGPPERVHGGTIMTIFDGVLSRAQQVSANNGVTGTLSVRFVGAAPIKQWLDVEAWVAGVEGRKTFLKAQMSFAGELLAEADGVWISTKARNKS